MEKVVRAICQKEGLRAARIQPLRGGQVNNMFRVDGAYVVRIGARADALARMQTESGLLRRLAGLAPVPAVYACGELDGAAYQVRQYLPGQPLAAAWGGLSERARSRVTAELAEALRTLHAVSFGSFGTDEICPAPGGQGFASWQAYIVSKFQAALEEIARLGLRMAPGALETAQAYFAENQAALAGGAPCLVHSDLSPMNILVRGGRITALLDFEYAVQAPPDYELWVPEAFCLYPTDYTDVSGQSYITADFSSLLPLLRRHLPELFAGAQLRTRLNLYHLLSALSSYLAWRKDHLDTIPPERMAAKGFYLARIYNFTFANGARLIA